MKYTFKKYYEYEFTLRLENGKTITNEEQNEDAIYDLNIHSEGEAMPQGEGIWLVDEAVFHEI